MNGTETVRNSKSKSGNASASFIVKVYMPQKVRKHIRWDFWHEQSSNKALRTDFKLARRRGCQVLRW